jgi:hypothetical protein
MAMVMKIAVFWVVTPHSLVNSGNVEQSSVLLHFPLPLIGSLGPGPLLFFIRNIFSLSGYSSSTLKTEASGFGTYLPNYAKVHPS